jgi:hypothetical protein
MAKLLVPALLVGGSNSPAAAFAVWLADSANANAAASTADAGFKAFVALLPPRGLDEVCQSDCTIEHAVDGPCEVERAGEGVVGTESFGGHVEARGRGTRNDTVDRPANRV